MKTTITEAQAEQIADRMVQRRTQTDSRYIHAEDAESQSVAEDTICAEVWRQIEDRYEVL